MFVGSGAAMLGVQGFYRPLSRFSFPSRITGQERPYAQDFLDFHRVACRCRKCGGANSSATAEVRCGSERRFDRSEPERNDDAVLRQLVRAGSILGIDRLLLHEKREG